MEIVKIKLSELTPDPQNAKDHPEDQVDQIVKSIQEFGNNDPIAVWGYHNLIVEGHGRYMALKKLGFEEAECIRLDKLTDEERRAYMLVHNQLTMNTGWIADLLKTDLTAIDDIDMSQFGFDTDMIGESPKEPEEDNYNPDGVNDTHNIKPGDVWQLGDHKLMCGDSTDPAVLEKLMDGNKADMLMTDPPYNVDYTGKTKDALKIDNDAMEDSQFRQFLKDAFRAADGAMKPGAVFYIWHADSEGYNFRGACNDTEWKIRQCLIWVKSVFVMGRQDYQWKHEPCLYGWKPGAGHYFTDSRRESTVVEEDRPDIKHMKKEDMEKLLEEIYSDNVSTTVIHEDKPQVSALHPTMKPIKLLAPLIKNSSRQKEIVLDTFGGSGSTMIACEQLNRSCYMLELDPHYCDVIITRWETYTGKTAVKL
ncbi:MAG: site-specific DNA-methyltransferase [Solobacterium sp.]|jgi:DNA modification methylase|nr:site-specific DNA-methyltransferase [Solobacterium sp.]